MREIKECLIIDDDQDDREIFLICIQKINECVNCQTADDGVDAISMLKSKEDYIPDFIFIDVNMPKLNGLECLKKIKEFDRLKNTKVFMYSTTAETVMEDKCKEFGAAGFIIKPAKTALLKEKLVEIFNK
jgi:CheY-like chemotaxis protein